jgi:hypothetical protein
MKGMMPVNFLLMSNVIKITYPKGLKVYDLKGSRVGRNSHKHEDAGVLKDINLLNCKKARADGNMQGIL